VWKIVQILADHRVKAWEKIDKAALKRIEKESESRTGLLTLFRKFVMLKIKRLVKEITRKDGQHAGIQTVLAPDAHLDELLLNIGCYLAERLPSDKAETANFRVGIYISEEGFMRPLRALDMNNGDYDVFKSFDAHKDHFSCEETVRKKPAHVVKCVNTHRTIIVEDCLEAERCGNFFFFNANQRSYLRSMLAFYLGPVCGVDGKMKPAAMVIDTDVPSFFQETDRESLDFALREFAHRIKLELLLHATLDKERR